jgi:hypothetical protein
VSTIIMGIGLGLLGALVLSIGCFVYGLWQARRDYAAVIDAGINGPNELLASGNIRHKTHWLAMTGLLTFVVAHRLAAGPMSPGIAVLVYVAQVTIVTIEAVRALRDRRVLWWYMRLHNPQVMPPKPAPKVPQ